MLFDINHSSSAPDACPRLLKGRKGASEPNKQFVNVENK